MRTVGVLGTLAIGFLVDSGCALQFTFRIVSIPVRSTDWVIERRVAVSFTVISRDTSAEMPFPDTHASHETFVIVVDSIGPTHRDEGLGLRTSTIAQVSPGGEGRGSCE